MKIILFFLILISSSCEERTDFDLRKIKFNELEFITKKELIIKTFGEPKEEKLVDCGYDDSPTSENSDHQLIYSNFTYFGGRENEYLLQIVDFDEIGKVVLHYDNKKLSGLTSRSEFIEIFGTTAKEYFQNHPEKSAILLMVKGSDVGGTFSFKNGRLMKFEYWTPC